MRDPTKEERAAIQMFRALTPLTPDGRMEAVATLRGWLCLDCGYPTPPEGRCYCTRDD